MRREAGDAAREPVLVFPRGRVQRIAMHFAWSSRARPRWSFRSGVRRSALVVCLVAAGISGCRWLRTGSPQPLRPTASAAVLHVDACRGPCTDSVDVVAMGVAGYLVVPWRDTTRLVLTPPMFTNPTVWWMTFGDLLFGTRPDTARISRRLAAMPTANADRLSRVHAVLVGHGHYDHLIDLPPLVPRMPRAVVYGSETVRNLLAPVPGLDTARRVAVERIAGRDREHAGEAIAVGPAVEVRVMPWAHAPNVGSITIAPGQQRTPLRALPRTVHGWKLGTTYAYAIDLLDANRTVAWRIVYHDASASADVQRQAAAVLAGMPPARQTAVIMTAANFDILPLYPDVLLAHLAPQHVVLGHWDDFFRSSERTERVVRGIDAPDLVARLEPYVGERWSAPRAGAVTRFRW